MPVRTGSDPPPERLGARPRTTPAGTTSGATSPVAAETTAPPTTSPGGKAPEAETRGPRLRNPERGKRSPGQQRPVHRVGPPRKSYSGAGGPQGTAWPREERPGTARPILDRPRRLVARPRAKTLAATERTKAAGGPGDARNAPPTAPPGGKLRRVQANPTSVGGCNATTRPGRENGPRGPGTPPRTKPAANDPRGGVSRTHEDDGETRGVEKPHGRERTPKGYRQRDKRRSGTVRETATPDGTARPANAEGTSTRGNLKRVVRTSLSNGAVTRPAGDDG